MLALQQPALTLDTGALEGHLHVIGQAARRRAN